MRSLWPLVFVVVSLVFAGCVEEPGAPAPDPLPDDSVVQVDPETGSERLLRRVPVRFADQDPTYVETSFPGTFEVTQHGDPLGDAQRAAGLDPGNHHTHPITEMVPVGVPVRLTAEVNADLPEGDLDIWISLPQEAVWTADFDTPYGGHSRVSYVVLLEQAADVVANVWYDEYDTSQSFDYELKVTVASAPQTIVGGIPVTLPVPSGASVELFFVGEPAERVWLWDPQDVLVPTAPPDNGRWNHTFDGRGGYVLFLPEGPAQANVTLLVPHEGGSSAPRPVTFGLLKQDIQQTDPMRFEANTPAEISFDLDRVPLQVGIQVDLDRFTKDAEATLDGPEGQLLRFALTDAVPMVSTSPEFGFGFTVLTDLGVDGLATGTYTASFSGDPNGPGSLSAWVVHYARN